jgi:hypothetical protein
MKIISHLVPVTLMVVVLSGWSALAAEVTIPHEFQANTPAVAQEVNDNFTAVKTAVDDNDIPRTLINVMISNSDNSISSTYELLRTVGTFTKSKSNTDLKVTWTGHGRMAGTAGTNFCDFQVRIDGNEPEGTAAGGGGRAVLYTNDSPFSVTAIFREDAAGTHTVSIWVRGSATSCTLNYGNFMQQVFIEEISPIEEVFSSTSINASDKESMVEGIKDK